MEPHEIVKAAHEAFPKLVGKLARITGKSEELYHSHGREPRTRNPMQSGNVSAVTHFIEYCHLNQAGERGAGAFIANRVHASLMADFRDDDLDSTQADHFDAIANETCDVKKWLGRFSLENASTRELAAFEQECSEAMDALLAAKTRARAMKRRKEAGLRKVA